MAAKIFLGCSVLLWLPYGVFCAFEPGYLAEVAGVVAATPTGTTEIRAMYGGLQAGIGALCAFALFRPDFARSALVVLCFLAAGLFTARFAGFLLDASGSPYTYGTLVFESSYALVCGYLLRSMPTLQVT
jgi:ABC-type thiamin/hydroxymethylpyrimidine transport system permease subunit